MDRNDLETVYTLGDPRKAELIKNALQTEGIRCFLEGIHQASEIGLVPNDIHVQVAAHHANRARKIIEGHEKGIKSRDFTKGPDQA